MTDVVVLVDPAADAAAVARELTASCVDVRSRVLLAPEHLLGVAFLSDAGSARWWEGVGVAIDSVVVCRHRPELVSELAADMVATWVLWCGDQRELDECTARGQVGVLAADAGDLAAEVVARVLEPRGGFRRRPAPAGWGPFARRGPADTGDEPEDASPPPPPPPPEGLAGGEGSYQGSPSGPTQAAEAPPMRWPELSQGGAGPRPLWARTTPAPRPFLPASPPLTVLSREQRGDERGAPALPVPPPREAPEGGAFAWVGWLLRRDGGGIGERLGAVGSRIEARHSLTLGMATSKGGVLKTTHTAGVGLVGEMALAPRGAAVALVEANPDNADLALDLGVPEGAPTVRELIACLEMGRPAPRAHVVAGTRLEVWPEARQSAGHGAAQIARLHHHLSAACSLVVVDFNNCLPDVAGGPAPELLHAWAPWVDVWIVPADCSQKALVAAGESIEALGASVRGGMRTAAFVVPLLVNDPGARRDPRHRELLEEFRTRGVAVVDVPHVPRVGRAAINQWRLTEVHRGLTRAWVALLEEAVSAAEERLAC